MIMKNRILLFAVGLSAFFAFIGCSDDDDANVEKDEDVNVDNVENVEKDDDTNVEKNENDSLSFVFDVTGNKIVEASQTISSEEFQKKLVGKAVKYMDGYEILTDGTLDSLNYFDRNKEKDGGSVTPPPYYFENDSIYVRYYFSDAIPGKGFKKIGYVYEEQSGCVVESDGRKVLQILEIGDDFIKIIAYIGYSSRLDSDYYGYFTYRFMTDEELKRMQDIYTMDFSDPNFSRW